MKPRRAITLALGAALIAFAWLPFPAFLEPLRFPACVVYERLTDPPGVRTDAFCLIEYWLREQERETFWSPPPDAVGAAATLAGKGVIP